jgi:hypothetical protein
MTATLIAVAPVASLMMKAEKLPCRPLMIFFAMKNE